jgi:hypothetical protein
MWITRLVAGIRRMRRAGFPLRRRLLVAALGAGCIAGCTSGTPGNHGGTSSTFAAGPAMRFLNQFGTGTYVAATQQGDAMTALSATAGGDLLVGGYTAGNLPGYTGAVGILKATLYLLDASGRPIWARELSSGAGDTIAGVAATSSGIVVAGTTMGALSGSNTAGIQETFLASYGTAGNLQWLKQYPSAVNVQVESMSVDGSGNIVLAGETGDSQHGQDLFVEKLDSTGNEQWEKTFGNGAVDVMAGVTVDGSGNIDATGSTNGPFPGGTAKATGVPFVLQLDGGTGSAVWVQPLAGIAALAGMSPSAIQTAPGGKLDLLGQVGSYPTNAQIEVVQLDQASGSVMWNTAFGAGTQNLPGQGFAVAANGDLYVAGMTHGGLIPGANASVDDIFLAKVGPTGSGVWAEQLGTGSDGPAIESSASTPVYVTLSNLNAVVGGMTAGQFSGFSNPNQAIELFVAGFPQ